MLPMEYILFCAGSLSFLQTGLNLGWPSYALPQLLRNDSSIPLTDNEGSWVASTFLLGTMSGSILLALTVDVFGRKTMLCVTSLPVCVSWLMIAFAKSPWYFYLARYIAGISDGVAFSGLPLYIAEVCNSNIRGFLISGAVVVFFIGTFLANLFGAFLSMTKVAVVCAILAVIPFCLYLSIPESPQFYVIKKKFDKAKISLKKFKKETDVNVELNSMKNTWIEQQANKKLWWQLFFDKNNSKYLGQANMSKYSWLVILGLFVFIVGYTAGLENIPIVLCSEIFPLNFKAYAVAIKNVTYGLIGSAMPKFFQYTKDEFGTYVPFVFFTTCSLGVLQSGLTIGWSSHALPQLLSNDSAIQLTNYESSWVASSFFIGIIFGSVLAALTVDVLEEEQYSNAKSSWFYYCARFIAGISDGATFSCLPLFVAEVCNAKIRGFLISGIILVSFVGVLLANILGAFLSITNVAVICAVLATVPFCLYLLIPESPQFYVIRKKFDKAKVSLMRFNKKDNVDVMLNILKKSWTEQQANKKRFFDKHNSKYLGLIIVLVLFQQCSGVMGIAAYIETIFKNVNLQVNPIVLIGIFYLLQIAVATLNSLLVDRIGRRPLLFISTSLVSGGLFCITIYYVLEDLGQINTRKYSWLVILGLFVFIIGYTAGLENVPTVLCSEIFSLNFKASASAIKNITFGLTGAAVSKFFQYTKDEFGTYVPFLGFTICSICGIFFTYFFVPETKKQSLEEIQYRLRKKKGHS
ncbi:hypothetical protein FQR65_LT01939 [Abscondita terminalis]|nr:hypothetical protein FQR65_LT01939 [Abscondita terminalis]